MQVDQTPDVQPCNELNAQVTAVHTLVDPFFNIDLYLVKNKLYPVVNVRMVYLGIVLFQVKRHGWADIPEPLTDLPADDEQDVDGIYAFKIMFIEDDLEILPLQLE